MHTVGCSSMHWILSITVEFTSSVYEVIYTVSGKSNPLCIIFHNAGKRCRILTKFCTNNETLNCKQTANFQENLSTMATVVVVLVWALKIWSVHYSEWRSHVTVIIKCVTEKISNNTRVFSKPVLQPDECFQFHLCGPSASARCQASFRRYR